MQAQDLRLGNYILIAGFKSKVYAISSSFSTTVNGFSEDKLEGILLNPEILEKAGFKEKELPENWANGMNGYEIVLQESANRYLLWCGSLVTIYEKPSVFSGMPCGNWVRHLHQLQNLYHALTNHELTIEI